MPTRPRIYMVDYHNIINSVIDRMNIFCHSEDKDMFLQIISKTAMIHKVVVHDYYLMNNHYHLLIGTRSDTVKLYIKGDL